MGQISGFFNQYRFLSNFWYLPNGTTVEHMYQAGKATNSDDCEKIMNAPSPGQAKRIARMIDLQPDWEQVKDKVMLDSLRFKFSFPDLRDKLLLTGDAELIEENNWGDTYWGMVRENGVLRGQNRLGKLLMQVRSEIR